MTALDFAIIGLPLIIILTAILFGGGKSMRQKDYQFAEAKKAIDATRLRMRRAQIRKAENELTAVRFVPIGVVPISASRSE